MVTFLDQLRNAERQNGSLLCVGLDPEPAKFPEQWRGDASRILTKEFDDKPAP